MKVLVAIANHGTKNRPYLDRLLAEYARMPHEVDVVVLSDQPKPDLEADGYEVRVGAPTSNPRSLPFAHRALMAERQDDYDLFVYSEDDTLFTPRNLAAWLEVAPHLGADDVLGFLRYERMEDGKKSYCGVHFHYRWEPDSAFEAGGESFARFDNDHSALFVLTRDQLKRCIASGGFLVAPHQGRYGILESAASDPYVRCGLRRVICLSRLDEFMLHHMPDLYLGRIGISPEDMHAQLDALQGTLDGSVSRETLFRGVPRVEVPLGGWNKRYYEPPFPGLANALGVEGKRVLSVGCGSGQLEEALVRSGGRVAAIPLDSIIGAMAARRRIEVLPPNLDAAIEQLGERRFDVLLLANVLHHIEDPVSWLRRLSELVESGGSVAVIAPNQPGMAFVAGLRGKEHPLKKRKPFASIGMQYTDPATVAGWLRAAGLQPGRPRFRLQGKAAKVARVSRKLLERRMGEDLLLTARRP